MNLAIPKNWQGSFFLMYNIISTNFALMTGFFRITLAILRVMFIDSLFLPVASNAFPNLKH